MRRLPTFIALALVVAACASPASQPEAGSQAPSSTEGIAGADSTSPPSGSGTDAPSPTGDTMAPKPPPEGPSAPDFTLDLQPEGSFTLSAAAKPVYMVFWAEW
ncbi:MAG: hypothetical protein O3B42_05905 [Actinomycetota bacterium]|nr:hypothetical protein [Actinomycetota bacterium]